MAKPVIANPGYLLKAYAVDFLFIENAKRIERDLGIKLLGVVDLPISVRAETRVALIDQLEIIQFVQSVIVNVNGKGDNAIKLFEIIASFDFGIIKYSSYRVGKNGFTFLPEFFKTLSDFSLFTTHGIMYSKLSNTFLQGLVLPPLGTSNLDLKSIQVIGQIMPSKDISD